MCWCVLAIDRIKILSFYMIKVLSVDRIKLLSFNRCLGLGGGVFLLLIGLRYFLLIG